MPLVELGAAQEYFHCLTSGFLQGVHGACVVDYEEGLAYLVNVTGTALFMHLGMPPSPRISADQ